MKEMEIARGSLCRFTIIDLRKKDGSMKAVGYAWLHKADFEPGVITWHIVGQKIKVIGRNLYAENRRNVRMLHGITRHRVPFIQEADQATMMMARETDTVIEKIEW